MFRKVLLEVAAKQVESGKMSRFQLFQLRLRMMLPSLSKEIEEVATQEALAQGKVLSVENIDWDKLRDFLEWLIPFLIELFK
jgi:hypothetical protein